MADRERPFWWPLFSAAERAVGTRLEELARSDDFAAAITRGGKLQTSFRKAYLKSTADALHRANLPAWSDLREIAERVAGLERRLADLTLELERGGGRKPAVRRRSSRRPPPASGR